MGRPDPAQARCAAPFSQSRIMPRIYCSLAGRWGFALRAGIDIEAPVMWGFVAWVRFGLAGPVALENAHATDPPPTPPPKIIGLQMENNFQERIFCCHSAVLANETRRCASNYHRNKRTYMLKSQNRVWTFSQ
jgi:hypothetical protein